MLGSTAFNILSLQRVELVNDHLQLSSSLESIVRSELRNVIVCLFEGTIMLFNGTMMMQTTDSYSLVKKFLVVSLISLSVCFGLVGSRSFGRG